MRTIFLFIGNYSNDLQDVICEFYNNPKRVYYKFNFLKFITMDGDKIFLLDGVSPYCNMGGCCNTATTDGLLSMIPGLFANMMGGQKTDPALIAALMNGKDNKGDFGGDGSWWLWILLMFFLFGNRGFGNFFGNGAIEGIPAQLNNETGRELLMQAIQGNRGAVEQLASAFNCTSNQMSSALCSIQGAIDRMSGQVGMSTQSVINAIQAQGCEIGNKIATCCCNLTSQIDRTSATTQNMINNQGYENRLATLNQTNVLQGTINNGFSDSNERATSQFNILSAKIDAQTNIINDRFCELEKREMQHQIDALREEKQTLQFAASQQAQTANLIAQLRPSPVPAFPSCSPYQSYSWGQVFGGNCCGNNCCNNGCCVNGANV